jgi:hypothetical protein
LWLIPDSSPSSATSARVRPGEAARASLVWINKEKWLKSEFSPEDCYPIGDKDVWVKQPTKLKFAEKILGKGERKSFTQALASMAGRGRGGRGPRPRSTDEDWGNWGDGYQYPPPMTYPPPPPFYQRPPPYGYFPNHPPHQMI